MALGINTNVASINAQNQLSKSQGQNDQALERLSSGLRINSAADDAAGLAISTRFESQISGQQVASRNAQDGISLAQTAEGALDEITNNLQRVRELSVQAANATNNDSDRAALNDEVQQRIEEIDRIASETDFNGLNVLDGSLQQQNFQVGANVGQTIEVDLQDGAQASDLGALGEASLDFDGTAGTFTLAIGDNEATDIDVDGNSSAVSIAQDIEGANGVVRAEASNEQTVAFTDITANDGVSLAINGEDVFEGREADADRSETIEAINELSDQTGVTASEEDGGTGIVLTSDDGSNIDVTQTLDDGGGGTAATGGFTLDANDGDTETFVGEVDIVANDDITIGQDENNDVISQVDDGAAPAQGEEATIEASGSLNDVSVLEVDDANDAITRIDASLDSVNSIRSELGAVQNRFESTIANLDNSIENLSSANSRIRDADFAAESANLSQSQVLQQAGISVLAQANARPQQVLSLLQ